jgi:prevent-host-death family protein
MPTVTAAEFKAKCLRLMDAVQQGGEDILITKCGKPVARLVAVAAPKPTFLFGCMKDSVEILGDIITPVLTAEQWDVPEELRE